ncbi:acetyl-CoA carboxylase biotin carboxyl carrier protein [Kamptonema sp. UHCC 0994]|uniref:acetyl-CoA carboxylase biotin carboxyl carrier protein n=1 Tax=Kamptonema sp. UHCC 0994 TaxID=3031329 RepID=UPI0023B9CE1A|nr:acetyl-CoA carboxylase biotin carboxyl carrier protein [Kamptonema sp. UHCC 0994]MDF0552766.1 acetyl-CoA carboxylase biotin carboxyl carrier protein [Kamptonema sp. UHCC 0994]
MQLDLNQLCELLTVLDSTGISELNLKSADFELTVRKGSPVRETGAPSLGNALNSDAIADRCDILTDGSINDTVALTGASAAPTPLSSGVNPAAKGISPTGSSAARPIAVPPPAEPKWVEVISPMVGTFYRAPGPDEPPFVQVGDRVRVGQTVCIIEAMKLMNEIEAEVSGSVVEILIQNGEPLEYGQPLMRINPD